MSYRLSSRQLSKESSFIHTLGCAPAVLENIRYHRLDSSDVVAAARDDEILWPQASYPSPSLYWLSFPERSSLPYPFSIRPTAVPLVPLVSRPSVGHRNY